MGLSRNKVAVSEGAAGSPPFYGESNLLETQQAEIEIETKKTEIECVIAKSLVVRFSVTVFGHSESELEKYRPYERVWGCSSVGRAPALQAGGHGFESHHLHQRG